MQKTVFAALVGLSLAFGAQAADDKKADNKQQSKMAVCNKDAGDKKGDERKKFMSDCLKAKPEMTAQQKQQAKMKTCNVEAKDKKGDDRKKFMSECLKKDA